MAKAAPRRAAACSGSGSTRPSAASLLRSAPWRSPSGMRGGRFLARSSVRDPNPLEPMPRLRIEDCFAVSADGYGAGPDQSLEHPLGVGGEALHEWIVRRPAPSSTMIGNDGGTTGIDDDFAARGFDERRRLDPRPQHVRSGPRPLARRQVEGLVGRRARRTTCRCSCSRTIRARRSRWRAARPSTSSPTASMPRWSRRAQAAGGRDVRIGGGVATCASTCRPGSSTRCISRLAGAARPGRGAAARASTLGARLRAGPPCDDREGDAPPAEEARRLVTPMLKSLRDLFESLRPCRPRPTRPPGSMHCSSPPPSCWSR